MLIFAFKTTMSRAFATLEAKTQARRAGGRRGWGGKAESRSPELRIHLCA